MLFDTPRLRCRRWIADDLAALQAVYTDPVAMRWVGDGQPITEAECRRWFEVTEANYASRGYGMFALEERSSGRVIGFCGLVHPGGQPEAELKYAFLQSHWGSGLASEVVPALLRHGAAQHGLQRVIATVAAGNTASQRVLLKSGLRLAELRRNEDDSITQVYEWHAAAPAAEVPAAPFFENLEKQRTQALVARDLAVIDRLHAPDYELITPAGRVFTRDEYRSAIAAAPFYAGWDHGTMRVKASAAMATVRYRATLTFPSGKVVDCWHTDIYECRDGRWQAVWSQATSAGPAA